MSSPLPPSPPRDEFSLIEMIKSRSGFPGPRTLLGIGDDAAILRPGDDPLLICTDAMAEGVHFDLSLSSAEDVGHKALASCLSDIAAMNGRPLAALFSLAVPAPIAENFLNGFYSGATALARRHSVDIIGGDLSASRGGVFIDVTCLGEATNPVRRSGARPGDVIAVSGTPGASTAGLIALRDPAVHSPATEALIRAHLRPLPRFDLLEPLRRDPRLCTALIDISDGLASELRHLAYSSGVDLEIEEALVPLHPSAVQLAARLGVSAFDWALGGGEDYELLAAFDSHVMTSSGGLPPGFTAIGRVLTATNPALPQLLLTRLNGSKGEIPAKGFVHFS